MQTPSDLRTQAYFGKSLKKPKIQWILYAMVLPAVVLTAIYHYGPLTGLAIAFQRYDMSGPFFGSEWIGLDNFKYIFKLPGFNQVIWNTIYIASMRLILQMIVPLVVALLLNEAVNGRFRRFVQTSIYLPNFISWVIVAGMLRDMLSPSDGIVNHIIVLLGFEPITFLADQTWYPVIVVLSDSWKNFGFASIIYMATLSGIDPGQYEAALIDGANRWQRIKNVTLPGLAPVIVLVLILNIGAMVQNAGFDQIVNTYSPLVYKTGDILDTLVYRIAFESSMPQYDIATAIGVLKSGVSFVLVSLSYWVAYKVFDYKIF